MEVFGWKREDVFYYFFIGGIGGFWVSVFIRGVFFSGILFLNFMYRFKIKVNFWLIWEIE